MQFHSLLTYLLFTCWCKLDHSRSLLPTAYSFVFSVIFTTMWKSLCNVLRLGKMGWGQRGVVRVWAGHLLNTIHSRLTSWSLWMLWPLTQQWCTGIVYPDFQMFSKFSHASHLGNWSHLGWMLVQADVSVAGWRQKAWCSDDYADGVLWETFTVVYNVVIYCGPWAPLESGPVQFIFVFPVPGWVHRI